MFFRILRQSFLRSRSRKALAVLTIALAASLITALLNISIDVGDKMSRELKSYGANINVIPKSESISLEIGGVDYNPLKGRVFLNESDIPKIKDTFWRNNILSFAPFLKITADTGRRAKTAGDGASKQDAFGTSVVLIGTYFNKHVPVPDEDGFRTGVVQLYPFWKVSGEWLSDDDTAGVLAGAVLAKEKGWQTGDTVTLTVKRRGTETVRASFVIKGILSTGGPEEKGIVAPLAAVQKLSGLEGKIQLISVSALTVPEDNLSRQARFNSDSLNSLQYDQWYCTAYVSAISQQIEEAIPGSATRPIWQVAEGEGAVIKKIQLLMLIVTITAFIASGLGISSLMSTTIIERSKEIGLIKALGASDREVYLLFLSEAAIVGIIGGMAGFIAGTGLSQIIGIGIFGSFVSFKAIVIPVILAISILNALAGSLVPSRLITRLYPAEVLHGQK